MELRNTEANIHVIKKCNRAIAQAVSRWLPRRRPVFEPGSGHVGFVVDKVALRQVSLSTSVFPANLFSTKLLQNHSVIWGWYNRPVVVSSELSLTLLRIIKIIIKTKL
jgi:hypothetical protein